MGHQLFGSFVSRFGDNDVYKQVMLEEFFKFILEGTCDLSLLAEPDRQQNDSGNHLPRDVSDNAAEGLVPLLSAGPLEDGPGSGDPTGPGVG
jgi:hypothetical protein